MTKEKHTRYSISIAGYKEGLVMPTGACGINCDVCRLNLLGLCTTCGGGKSDEAKSKLATQERILGSTCAVLSCCVMNSKEHCIRDCSQFPCENYERNPYPFSQSYLDMQKRRRQHPTLQMDPWGESIAVPEELWDQIMKKDLNLLGTVSLANTHVPGEIRFDFLNEKIVLDLNSRVVYKIVNALMEPVDNPLLDLICLTYFTKVDRLYPMGKDLIGSKDMKQALYFTGKNKLNKEPVLRRFKDDLKEFIGCAQSLGGQPLDLADAAAVLYPFPRVPIYYLLWEKQKEYPPRISILFDRSIEDVFSPPMIWGFVNLVNSYLLSQ